MTTPVTVRRQKIARRGSLCRLIFLIGVAVSISLGDDAMLAAPEKTTEAAAILKAAQEAALSTRTKLRSGLGTGTYEVSKKLPGDKEFQVLVKAKAEVCFDGDKYNVKLQYDKDDVSHMQGRIIIFDGTTLIINPQSSRIRPKGAEARTTPF